MRMLSILIILLIILIVYVIVCIDGDSIWKNKLELYGLEQRGVFTKGVIFNKFEAMGSRKSSGRITEYSFEIDGIKYSKRVGNLTIYNMNIGDTIDVIYLSDNPDICNAKIEFESKKNLHYFEQKYFNPISERFFIRSLFIKEK